MSARSSLLSFPSIAALVCWLWARPAQAAPLALPDLNLGEVIGDAVLGGLWLELGLTVTAAWQVFAPDPARLGEFGTGASLQWLGVATLAVFALVALGLGRMRLLAERQRLDMVRRFVEQGLETPASLLRAAPRADLRRGIVLIAAGAGMVAAGFVLADRGLGALGLVPIFIGGGYLVSYRLAQALDARHGEGP